MSSKNLDAEEIDEGPSNLSPSDNIINDQQLQQQPVSKKRKVDESDKHSEEDLEEGELRDDDDDEDEDDDDNDNENNDNKGNDNFAQESASSKRSNINNNPNNNNNNISNNNSNNSNLNNNNNDNNYHSRELSYGDSGPGHRGHGGPQSHRQYYPHPNQHLPHPGYPGPHHNMQPNQGPPPPYMMHLQNRRQMSPNSQPPPEMMHYNHYPPNHYNHYENNSHYNNSRYPPMGDPHPMPLNYPPGPMPMNAYVRGGAPGPVGPIQKQTRCRFYSKYGNKCTWGDDCRFMHIDDSPEPVANEPYPDQPGLVPSSTPPPPGNTVRLPSPGNSSAVHYDRKHRLAYESAPWNDSRSAPASGNVGSYVTHGAPGGRYGGERLPPVAMGERPTQPPLGDRPPQGPPLGDPSAIPMSRGAPVGYHSRHAYYGRPDHPAVYGGSHPYNHYPPYHPSSGYPNAYRPSMAPHHSHNPNPSKYSSHPRTSMPPEARRSRSSKMGHDEDESSWSDSGSEDSILGQSSRYSHHHHHHNHHSHRHSNKANVASGGKRLPEAAGSVSGAGAGSDEHEDPGGSGTPPGEPLPEDRDRQEILLNKLKEIEEAMAKKKSEQEDGAAK